MTQGWLALKQRGAKTERALRTIPHLECLEERNLLTGLVVVPSPNIKNWHGSKQACSR